MMTQRNERITFRTSDEIRETANKLSSNTGISVPEMARRGLLCEMRKLMKEAEMVNRG